MEVGHGDQNGSLAQNGLVAKEIKLPGHWPTSSLSKREEQVADFVGSNAEDIKERRRHEGRAARWHAIEARRRPRVYSSQDWRGGQVCDIFTEWDATILTARVAILLGVPGSLEDAGAALEAGH